MPFRGERLEEDSVIQFVPDWNQITDFSFVDKNFGVLITMVGTARQPFLSQFLKNWWLFLIFSHGFLEVLTSFQLAVVICLISGERKCGTITKNNHFWRSLDEKVPDNLTFNCVQLALNTFCLWFQIAILWNFPGGPLVKNWDSTSRGTEFDSWLRN